jgi:hypothetical protein
MEAVEVKDFHPDEARDQESKDRGDLISSDGQSLAGYLRCGGDAGGSGRAGGGAGAGGPTGAGAGRSVVGRGFSHVRVSSGCTSRSSRARVSSIGRTIYFFGCEGAGAGAGCAGAGAGATGAGAGRGAAGAGLAPGLL